MQGRQEGLPRKERLEFQNYYFGHGEDRSGARFAKVVEKIADYFRIELSKDIFYLLHNGIKPEWEEIKTTPEKNAGTSDVMMKRFELDHMNQKKERKLHSENKCKACGIILEQCREMTTRQCSQI